MSLATIRSLFERELSTAYSTLPQPVMVVFDNVQEVPPADASGEFVQLTISFPSLTEPVLCLTESGIENIRGNIQISCYGPRARGMKRLEELASVAAQTLNNLQTAADPDGVRPRIGSISGPEAVLSGDAPHALVTLSAPFTAKG
jgi:hypothetical protein